MLNTIKSFWFSILITVLALTGVFLWGGIKALVLAFILMVLEVTLSFDNAVVNARVLTQMTPVWQQRFITWGIPVAVFGTRFLLPIFIVAIAVSLSPLEVAHIALFDPAHYGELLHGVHQIIAAFGGMFLLMVALKYFFDSGKDVHWIGSIERHLTQFGKIEAIEIGLALGTLITLALFAGNGHAEGILFGGSIGIVLFIFIQGLSKTFSGAVEKTAVAGGFALFMYLEVLDAAFSLDGVVGAFAVTTDLPIIVAGLGIGAFFVRSLTVYMVKEKTLDTLVYLEHGAHWAIFGLALCMFISIFREVPEIVTGGIGFVFVALAYYSSIKERKRGSIIEA